MYKRVIQIDDVVRGEHHYLQTADRCYYMGEYTAREGYTFSETNQLISNFKKSVDRKGERDWKFKQHAIHVIGQSLENCIGGNAESFTIVPAPSSKCKTDPAYDGRLLDALHVYKHINRKVDFRELILRDSSSSAMHASDDKRPSPEELVKQYRIDTTLIHNTRPHFIIFDDMITTGTTFKACQMLLNLQFPHAEVVGVFVSRRVVPNPFKVQ